MNSSLKHLFLFSSIITFSSCSKAAIGLADPIKSDTLVEVKPVNDPKVALTQGFYLDNWQPKNFIAPSFIEEITPTVTTNTVTVDASEIITKIPSPMFGHNANTWMGTFVDSPSLITDVKNLTPNIIRWPAGSGSNVYFWNAAPFQNGNRQTPSLDYLKTWGIPNQFMDKSGVKVDTKFFFGKTNDNWRASLENYYDLLKLTNSKGSICINYGFARYGITKDPVATAAKLAADWVRYDKGRTEYWEIGNENYADWETGYRIDTTKNQDGQPEYLTGKIYAKHFKVFADSMRKAAAELGVKIKIGAVLQESPTQSWQVMTTQTWNATLIPELANKADFYIVHNYVTPYNENSSAPVIINAAKELPKKMIDFVSNEVMNNGGEPKPFAFSEWNMWAKDQKQQVSNVSGLFAVIIQAESIKNKYGMSARWDLYNGWDNGNDHGLFSDGGSPDDPKMNPRPSFYHMYYFQKNIGDRMIPNTVVSTANNLASTLVAYSSSYNSGELNVTLINPSGQAQNVEIKTTNFNAGERFYWYSLKGDTDNGDFSRKVIVNGSGPKGNLVGGPSDYATLKAKSALSKNGIKVTVPAWGSVYLVVEKK
jgi:hypothetical protein